ncbi:hypothetical protein DFH28DRAFT_933062 [Melampsora americana]|nr:hypothetical protein DFH28DRAFT_933062 [Melampsora americana]
MPPCLCSNCDAKASDYFLAQQTELTSSNFTKLVLQHNLPKDYRRFEDRWTDSPTENHTTFGSIRQIGVADRLRQDIRFIRLFINIQHELKTLFDLEYPNGGFYQLHNLFSISKLWNVCGNYDIILEGMSLNYIFGSEPLPTSYGRILLVLRDWTQSRDMVAVLKASEEEMKMQIDAIAIAAEHEKAAQDAKQARYEARCGIRTQASSATTPTSHLRPQNRAAVTTGGCASASAGQKRKASFIPARRGKKAKTKEPHHNSAASLAPPSPPPPPNTSTSV